MNISILVVGSSRRNVATATQASRRTRAHSSPCSLPLAMISPPLNWAANRSKTIWPTLLALRLGADRTNRDQGRLELLAELLRLLLGGLDPDGDLVVPLAAL